MRLADLQQEFGRFLYTRKPSDEQSRAVMEALSCSGPVAPEIGLGVYRNNLLASVVLELRSTYSRTLELLGQEAFDGCARSYLFSAEAEGSRLGEVGAGFAGFLRSVEREEVADLADLEWAKEHAFFAPSDAGIDEAQLRKLLEVSPDRVHLKLRTSFTLLTPRFPVHREGWRGPEPDLRIAVWRDRGLHRADEVEAELWPVLSAIDAGASLEAIASLPEIREDPQRLQECLALLLMRRWLRA
ncbi:MAG: putative DNA-binding domain-containing protein [Deltaproteobacteria bacterium]|nr:putative DNA-binding domain-containing protein [Deltaproteobacteria bacterium]MBW2363151.1 putative DNA-binding domain-containing protein [Deltaproteobacteria bacterium]